MKNALTQDLESGELSKETELDLIRREAAGDLLFTTTVASPAYQAGRMHARIARLIEEAATVGGKRIIINAPPRHGKSRMVAVEGPAWLLATRPSFKIMCASYSAHLSTKHSREALARIKCPAYRWLFPDFRLGREKQASNDWETVSGGGYMATSVTGSMTGLGADLIIIDDPNKDYAEAHSAAIREKVWQWFLSTAMTRLTPKGSIIIIMTRWHVDDLVGRLTSVERRAEMEDMGAKPEIWDVHNFPAIAGLGDTLGRDPGEALHPERINLEALQTRRAALGAYLWSAMYDGNPVPKGGNYVDASDMIVVERHDVPADLRWVRYWDLATTARTSGNYTAGIAGAKDKHGNLYLRDMKRGQWDWPKVRALIVSTAKIEQCITGVECGGMANVAASNLKEHADGAYIIGIPSMSDKLARALPWFALAGNRKVFLVRGEWLHDFISEVEAFPSGANDDQVDAVSGVNEMLAGGGHGVALNKPARSVSDIPTRRRLVV